MAHRQRPSTKVKIPIAIAKSAVEFQVNTLLHAQSSDTPYISGAVVFKDQWDLPGRLSQPQPAPRPTVEVHATGEQVFQPLHCVLFMLIKM